MSDGQHDSGRAQDEHPAAQAGPSRRAILVSAAATAGVLTFAFAVDRAGAQSGSTSPGARPSSPRAGEAQAVGSEITCWVVIRPDDSVVIRLARSEMGQGAYTALPMLVAEELECDWAKVSVEQVAPSENLRRKLVWQDRVFKGAPRGEALIAHWGSMATEFSQSTRSSQSYLRQAGAIARTMLIEAAAKEWNVSAFECSAAAGIITHTPSGRKTGFGRVASAAAAIPPPSSVPLKDPKTWKLAGKAMRQLDSRSKVDGSLTYAIDVRLPGMLHGVVAQSPVFGGKIATFEPTAIAARAGVRHIVRLDAATVCVIADSFWQARTALDALAITWDDGPGAAASSHSMAAMQREGLVSDDAVIAFEAGNVVGALGGAARIVEAAYATPMLHQAALEPLSCTARIVGDLVEVWAGTQNGEATLAAAAGAAGVDPERVRLHMMHLGGGFGRRGTYNDIVRLAVLAARLTGGRAVQLVYTREEDMTHGFYRPASHIRFKAALDDKNALSGLFVRLAGQSIHAWHEPRRLEGKLDRAQANGLLGQDFDYAIESLRVEISMRNTHVPPGRWRGEYHGQNAFYRECFLDEVALAAGKNPLEFRTSLLGKATRALRVLEMVADKAGWTSSLPKGVGRGIALDQSFGCVQATVAEVSVAADGRLRVHRIVNALDCGHVVNPNSVEQQMAGATVMALTALLHGEITIENGRVKERNFDTYQMLRMADMPRVENHIIASLDGWGGVGEASLPSIAPAVCNAIFSAIGKRIRTLPLKHHRLGKA